MSERKYVVELAGQIVARDMDIYTATILIKALAQEYYMQMEHGGKITLYEEPRAEDSEDRK
jgi:hypothetical protein